MKRIIFTIVVLLAGLCSEACINEFGTDQHGNQIRIESFWAEEAPRHNPDTAALKEAARDLHEEWLRTHDWEKYADYGAQLIYLGDYDSAMQVYHQLAEMHADHYVVASNLGTLYELTGENELALEWITKAIALNPDSHGGSEWIHLKILEYKISDGTEPLSSIIDLDCGTDTIPAYNGNLDLSELADHLYIQLYERMYFIPRSNSIVGRLLFDLGNAIYLTESVESAAKLYQYAIDYGYDNELIRARLLHCNAISRADDFEDSSGGHQELRTRTVLGTGAFLLTGGILLVIAIILLLKFRKR